LRNPARDLHWFAPLAHVELRDDIRGKLARIHLPRLRQGHQRVGLVIAKLGIGTRADKQRSGVGIGQDGSHGPLETLLD